MSSCRVREQEGGYCGDLERIHCFFGRNSPGEPFWRIAKRPIRYRDLVAIT